MAKEIREDKGKTWIRCPAGCNGGRILVDDPDSHNEVKEVDCPRCEGSGQPGRIRG